MEEMESGSPPQSLNYSLDSLPTKLFRGYDRHATDQLLTRLNSSYKRMLKEHGRLQIELADLHETVARRTASEQRLDADIEQLETDLEKSRQCEQALGGRLDRAKTYMEEEISRVRADLERELERTRGELAGYEKREHFVTEMLDAAKRAADRMKTEARDEATLLLKKARKREQVIIREAKHEFSRLSAEKHDLEAEKERLTAVAAELREDLSTVLIATLEQLKARNEEQEAPPPADDQPADAGEPQPPRSRSTKADTGEDGPAASNPVELMPSTAPRRPQAKSATQSPG